MFQYFRPLKLASLLSWLHEQMKKVPWKTKDLPDQVQDLQDKSCLHAIHSQLPLLTSRYRIFRVISRISPLFLAPFCSGCDLYCDSYGSISHTAKT